MENIENNLSIVPDPISFLKSPLSMFRMDSPLNTWQLYNGCFAFFENIFTDKECEYLVSLVEPKLTRSYVFDSLTGDSVLNSDRTSKGAFFSNNEDYIVDLLDARLAKICNWPLSRSEKSQFLQYGPGELYVPHYDFFHPDQPGSQHVIENGGNRVATFIVYLDEPEEGGCTFFPDLDIRVKPKKGCGLFFSYNRPSIDTKTLHSGEPVIKGKKTIMTKWFRESDCS